VHEDTDCVGPQSVSHCVTLGKISKFLAKSRCPCVEEERSFWSVLYLMMASPVVGWITAVQWGMNGLGKTRLVCDTHQGGYAAGDPSSSRGQMVYGSSRGEAN
jgi:hypothetical protein